MGENFWELNSPYMIYISLCYRDCAHDVTQEEWMREKEMSFMLNNLSAIWPNKTRLPLPWRLLRENERTYTR